MSDSDTTTSSDRLLRFALRLIGTSSLFALIFVAAPYSWMNDIHAWLGMGELPDEPVVGYLARSVSGFYAILGGLFWVVSFDLVRYRTVLIYLGIAISLFGLAIFVIDWLEGLPLFWTVWEGPFLIVFGLVVFYLSRAVKGRPGN